MKNQNASKCWLCKREFYKQQGRFPVGPPTKHHIIPKQKYHGKWKDADVVPVCKACQHQMHKTFTNYQLKEMTKTELRNHKKIRSYIKWIRKDNISQTNKTSF
ncbi:MAG: hypothetical protein JSW60_06105 [Thermoplasmatales archaeon]|nr:MAG: hypothetical protein JSW60_06105 [Thermoplasmatales archaeon]